MKKILILLFISSLASFNFLSAQNNDDLDKILNYIKEDKFTECKQIIDKAESKSENKENAKFWFYKALFYHSVFEIDDKKLNEKYPDAIDISYESYKKALKYDKDKSFNEQIFKALGYLTNQFMHEGSVKYNNADYKKALKYFENTIEINTMPEIMFYDTIVYYNAALSAEKLKEYDKAIGFYKILISYKYGEGRMYKDLAGVYKQIGKNDLYEQTLLEGAKLYPKDNEIYIELINHYLLVSDVDNAFKYVNLSIKIDSTNAGIFFVLGSLYENKKDINNAEKAYKKALGLDTKYVDAAYNLGALYYNKANDIYNKAKSKSEKTEYENYFKKSLKYFKIVDQIQPDEKDVLISIFNIYLILNMEKEKNEINERLKKLD